MELWVYLGQGKLLGQYLSALINTRQGRLAIQPGDFSQTDENQVRNHDVEQLLSVE